jgi:hypothetical protein
MSQGKDKVELGGLLLDLWGYAGLGDCRRFFFSFYSNASLFLYFINLFQIKFSEK